MRIQSSKFWGWVVASLLVGLGIGLVIMLVRTGSLSNRITVLQNQIAAGASATGTTGAVQQQLAAAEASVTALTDQNATLTSDLQAAQAQLAAQGTSGTTSTTTTIAVTSRKVTPSTVATSGTITMTVKVTGSPTSVTMRVYNSSKSFDKTYTLKKVSTSGGTQTWRLAVKAPSKVGTYSYYATATKGSTHVTMKGASPSSFTVN
jgi:cell division protein FtsB